MQYTAGQAAKATGKNIATITRAIKSGKISAQKDTTGAWRIEASELHRVYALRTDVLRKGKKQDDARALQEQSKDQTSALKEELAVLRERVMAQSELLEERAGQIADLKEDRDKWRHQANNFLSESRPPAYKSKKITFGWWPSILRRKNLRS